MPEFLTFPYLPGGAFSNLNLGDAAPKVASTFGNTGAFLGSNATNAALKTAGSTTLNTTLNASTNAASKGGSSIWGSIGKALTGEGAKNFGSLLSGVGAVGMFGVSVWNTAGTMKNEREKLKLAKEQMNIENERYTALENERKKNNEHFSSAWADWAASDEAKKQMAELPTNRV